MQKLYIYKNQDFENNLWLSKKGKWQNVYKQLKDSKGFFIWKWN